jgi:Rrf2 family protein
MLLTRKTDYALVALAGLARRRETHQSARTLAVELHLPLPVLRNILKLLASQGFLVSSRGPSGGYRLARDAAQINLGQVVEAVEGPVQLLSCCPPEEGAAGCRLEDSCLIKSNVRQIHDSLRRFLQTVTLAEIAADPYAASSAGAGPSGAGGALQEPAGPRWGRALVDLRPLPAPAG